MTNREDSRFVNSLEKAFIVLEALRHSDRGLGLKKISERSGLDISTVQRCVFTLRELGYLVREDDSGVGFRPSIRFLNFSFAALRQDPVVRIATDHVSEAQRTSEYPIWFSLLDGDELLYILRLRGESYMNALFSGRRGPLYGTAGGRAVLAGYTEKELQNYLARTTRTAKTSLSITDETEIRAAIRSAQTTGYAISWQEMTLGEVVAGSAIVDSQSRPIGAIHVSASVTAIDRSSADDILAPISMSLAATINQSLAEFGL